MPLKQLLGQDMDLNLRRILLNQQIIPCLATGRSPAELLLSRVLKTLDSMRPDSLDAKGL